LLVTSGTRGRSAHSVILRSSSSPIQNISSAEGSGRSAAGVSTTSRDPHPDLARNARCRATARPPRRHFEVRQEHQQACDARSARAPRRPIHPGAGRSARRSCRLPYPERYVLRDRPPGRSGHARGVHRSSHRRWKRRGARRRRRPLSWRDEGPSRIAAFAALLAAVFGVVLLAPSTTVSVNDTATP
jgi:hypothetical protein